MKKRKYAVGVIQKPVSEDQLKFNLDAHTLLNMLEGMSYEKAVEQAKIDMKEFEEA